MRRGRRLLLQIALLPVFYAVSELNTPLFQGIVAVVLLVAWLIAVAVAVTLVYFARQEPVIESLVDAGDNAASVALAMTGFAAAALVLILRLAGLFAGPVGDLIVVALSWGLVVNTAPSFTWARALRDVWLPMVRRSRRRE